MIVVPILRSGVLADEFCRSIPRANVEAVFDRCFYLRCGDAFICVGTPGIGNGPLTLTATVDALPDLDLRPGLSASVCEQHITIGVSVRFSLDRAVSWRPPAWPPCPSPASLIDACDALARRAAIDAPDGGLARYAFRARVAVFEHWLYAALDARTPVAIASRDAVRGLIGLGPGLTPSGDDFLSGALALLDAIGERPARAELARAISEAAPGLTSPLSACFLGAAADGHIGEALYRAVSSTVTGNVEAAAAAANEIGHSSGWDMMAGIVMALRIVAAARLETQPAAHAFAFS